MYRSKSNLDIQAIGGLLLFFLFVLGVIDCCNGKQETVTGKIVDKTVEISHVHHKGGHYSTHTDYYVFAELPDGLHRITVSRTKFYRCQIGDLKSIRIYYGKVLKVPYVRVLL